MENTWSFYLLNTVQFFVHWFVAILQTFFPFLKPKKSVKDEIILITGAGSGIGQLMAIEFAKLGKFFWAVCDLPSWKSQRICCYF